MRSPTVTIVLPTYNRPDVLAYTIRSVLRQTYGDWKLLIIGDSCSDPTNETVGKHVDPRIFYVNLPERWGEQAGPNTIGMRIADTPYIALLNHDDIWLDDHLALAISRLDNTDIGIHFGQACFAHRSELLADGSSRPYFSEANPAHRGLEEVFFKAFFLFEPCSAWVFQRSLAEKIGGWTPARLIYRTPLQDWLLRAWRADTRATYGNEISVVKVCTHAQARGGPSYGWGARDHDWLERFLTAEGSDAMRNNVRQDLMHAKERGHVVRDVNVAEWYSLPDYQWIAERLLSPGLAEVFYRTSWDSYEQYCRLVGIEKGAALRNILEIRTGETIPALPDLERHIDFVRESLASSGRW